MVATGEIADRSQRCHVHRQCNRTGHHQRTHPASIVLGVTGELQHLSVLLSYLRSHRISYSPYEVRSLPFSFSSYLH